MEPSPKKHLPDLPDLPDPADPADPAIPPALRTTETLNTEHCPPPKLPFLPAGTAAFLTTHWTRVLAARGDSTLAGDALRELCADYYAPVTAFLQRAAPGGRGDADESAREAAHGFFEWVLTRDPFAAADPQRGRFRSYLLGALKHWLANERARRLALKRGGRIPHLPLDPAGSAHPTAPGSNNPTSRGGGGGNGSSTGYPNQFSSGFGPALDPPDPATLPPDREFDRQWALHVLRRALEDLESEFTRTGEARRFALLKPFLTGEAAHGSLAALAAAEGWPESTARSHLHRLRHRFRQSVKRQIAPTLGPTSGAFEAETTDEMAILMAALTGA